MPWRAFWAGESMEHLLELLPDYLTGHLQLTLLALLAATLLSVPLGIVASRTPRLQALVLGFADTWRSDLLRC